MTSINFVNKSLAIANDLIKSSQAAKKTKSADTFIEMIQHFWTKHPNNKDLIQNLAKRGVETHPTNMNLIYAKLSITDDVSSFAHDVTRAISLKPSSEAYLGNYYMLQDQGNMKEAVINLKKAIEYARKEKLDTDYILELEKMLGNSSSIGQARKLQKLPLTDEQVLFNKKVEYYWSKYQKEINEIFEEVDEYQVSSTNCTRVTTSLKDLFLGSVKKIGKAEDFGLEKNFGLYHGTKPDAKASIETFGFDLSKCVRTETGKGAYFGFNKDAVKSAYGENIVNARFIGKNIAEITPGSYEIAKYRSFSLANILNLNFDDNQKLIDEIISKYYNNLLDSMGIQGVIVNRSYKATMPYFMVPNPSKYIEIL